jgi:hypothetical protein
MQVRTAGSVLAAALLLSACGGGGSKDTKTAAPQRLDVTARDFALSINGSRALRPGPVTITARNTGKQAHGMVLAKLNDGVDTKMLVDAITQHPDRISNMLTYVGGTTTLPKGISWSATTSFDAGNYALLDVGASTGGRLNVTRPGEVQGFTVSGKQVLAAVAAPTAKVSLYDYGIQVPRSIPATGRIQVANTGSDTHQLIFLRVRDAAEAKRVLHAFKSGRATRTSSRPIEVLAPTSDATSTTVSYRLPKGAYIAYCSLRSAASQGATHAALGMIAAFAVK